MGIKHYRNLVSIVVHVFHLLKVYNSVTVVTVEVRNLQGYGSKVCQKSYGLVQYFSLNVIFLH